MPQSKNTPKGSILHLVCGCDSFDVRASAGGTFGLKFFGNCFLLRCLSGGFLNILFYLRVNFYLHIYTPPLFFLPKIMIDTPIRARVIIIWIAHLPLSIWGIHIIPAESKCD